MTDASELAKKVLSTSFEGDLALQTLLTNEFQRAQAEAFSHAANLTQEWLNAVDPHIADEVSGKLRQTAAAIHPSQKSLSILAPSLEIPAMDKTDTVIAEGVVRAGQSVTVNLDLPPAA